MRNVPFFLYNLRESDLQEISEVIVQTSTIGKERGVILGETPNYTERLEDIAIKITSAKHAVAVNSEISALLVALQALELKRNHRVICSVYCHPFIPECIRYFDAEPFFVDIDPNTLAMLPERCEQLLQNKDKDRIKAIIVSHIGGTLVDMEPFYQLKEKHQIALIEDASFAMGLKDEDGRYVGTDLRTDFAIASHYLGTSPKLFNTGMVFTSNGELAKKCRTLRYHSKIRDNSNNGLFYDVVDMSLDHTMTLFSSKMALCLIDRIEEFQKRREEIANMYYEGLKDIKGLVLPQKNPTNIYTFFIVRFKKSRDKIASLLRDAGVQTALHFIPANLLSYYKHKYSLKVTQYPYALQVYQEVLSLPIYSGMSDEDVKYVIDTLKEIAKKELE